MAEHNLQFMHNDNNRLPGYHEVQCQKCPKNMWVYWSGFGDVEFVYPEDQASVCPGRDSGGGGGEEDTFEALQDRANRLFGQDFAERCKPSDNRGAAEVDADEPRQESVPPGMECAVCMEGRKDTLFLPCKHVATCKTCADKLPTPKRCPICRGAVLDQIAPIYIGGKRNKKSKKKRGKRRKRRTKKKRKI